MTGMVLIAKAGGCGVKESRRNAAVAAAAAVEDQENQLSLVTLLLAALRKSMLSSCKLSEREEAELMSSTSSAAVLQNMEIGCPTNVQHLTHVTFDRFHGFLGLPIEFEVEIPCKVPSASFSVFGVSAQSMQCSYDTRGNSVPTILLLMQDRLYTQGGLKAEGIFRINPENSKEEHVRDQLNRGIVPQDIDVHCLAGLIKAWFRELPSGVLDGLSPEEVLQCNTEEDAVELIQQLGPTETELLNWAIDLMADVVEQEESNKMNARNIAMVFAPNMTQMSDPLTALMHAVQVLNLLKTLVMRTLREREENITVGGYSPRSFCSSDRQTDDEVDSQEETNSRCELRDIGQNNTGSENEDEVESLCKIEECFLTQTDDEVDSQEETNSRCELRDIGQNNTGSENEDEVESLCKIDECFLTQMDDDNNTRNSFRLKLDNDLRRQDATSSRKYNVSVHDMI